MKTIERLRELLKAGTQEPWEMLAGEHQVTIRVGTAYVGAPYQKPHGRGACPVQLADGCLMVEGRNALPALLAVAEAAEKVRISFTEDADGNLRFVGLDRATQSIRDLNSALRTLDEVTPTDAAKALGAEPKGGE